MKKLGLVPLSNFAVVDNKFGLYRSAQPLYDYQYIYLRDKLKIKTIINLRDEADIDSKHSKKFGINVMTFAVKDHTAPTMEQAQLFMNIVKEPLNYPMLFHCQHGHGRTSTFCVLARVARGWTVEEAMEEELNSFQYHFKYGSQIEFLEYLKQSLSQTNLVMNTKKEVTATGKIPENVGFPAGFPTGKVEQPTPTDPADYGKTMTDQHGRTYVQTKEGRIY